MTPTSPAPDHDDSPQEGIETLASDWLGTEEQARNDPDNAILQARAERLSEAYAAAIASATVEDLRLAWEAARRRQGQEEMGSRSWGDARRVSELLRTEYTAATSATDASAPAASPPQPAPVSQPAG
jgi:hypothetical protein